MVALINKWINVFSIFLLTANATGMEISNVEHLIEANGYRYIEEASGVKKLSSGAYILRVFTDVKDERYEKSVIVVVNDGSITPIDDPVYAGDGVQIEVSDINSDGNVDIVVSEYYEPSFSVRVFFNGGNMNFKKVLQEDSFNIPEFIDLGEYFGINGQVKEIILTKDPYNSRFDPLFCSTLYAFNGTDFQRVPTTN